MAELSASKVSLYVCVGFTSIRHCCLLHCFGIESVGARLVCSSLAAAYQAHASMANTVSFHELSLELRLD